MTAPISVRLDEKVRAGLEAAAKERGIGLATTGANARLTRRARSGSSVSARKGKPWHGTSPRTPRHGNSANFGVRPRLILADMATLEAGQIGIADWRDALPKEANKLRPAVVVEDATLFGCDYPNVVLVPLTEDASTVLPVRIDPTPENGCMKICFAVSALVAGTSRLWMRATPSRVAEYLTAAMEDPNPDVFLDALGDVAKARGMAQIAKEPGPGRESLYKALGAGAHPRHETIKAVLGALGARLSVVPLQPQR
ncbi:MAG TPA: addiction module antidote protein [Acetobacteraceae bacterium]|nr:addiction module antidote protein [Acetobacteraceae bacterium]